jgi:hypothetical protein
MHLSSNTIAFLESPFLIKRKYAQFLEWSKIKEICNGKKIKFVHKRHFNQIRTSSYLTIFQQFRHFQNHDQEEE